jgi:hypothetical protein
MQSLHFVNANTICCVVVSVLWLYIWFFAKWQVYSLITRTIDTRGKQADLWFTLQPEPPGPWLVKGVGLSGQELL